MTTKKTEKTEKTETLQRTRLTHAQWHQVAIYVSGCVDPDTDHLSCTPSELVGLVRQDCELLTNPGQLREMCKQLGLTIRLDKPGAADVAALAHQVQTLASQLVTLTDQVGSLVQNFTDCDDCLRIHGADIEKIKGVLNDHAQRLVSWRPADDVAGPADDLNQDQQAGH